MQAYDTENVEKTFRKTPHGQSVFGTLARWIAFRLAKSGFKLSAIGITKERALIELQPLMPEAHLHYNANGEAQKPYTRHTENVITCRQLSFSFGG